MNPLIIAEAEKAGAQYLYSEGALHSVKPAETGFGYFYFAHAIPPFKPEHTLILGYGGGTVAALMRKIWGQCKITGVDTNPQCDYIEYKMKNVDAKDYIWDITSPKFTGDFFRPKYDYVCIDLWQGLTVPQFVFDVEFVVRLREASTKLVCLNTMAQDVPKLKAYHDYGFKFDRSVMVENNMVTWWSVQEK